MGGVDGVADKDTDYREDYPEEVAVDHKEEVDLRVEVVSRML